MTSPNWRTLFHCGAACLVLCLALACTQFVARAAPVEEDDADEKTVPVAVEELSDAPSSKARLNAQQLAAEQVVDEPQVSESDREHWSFRPLRTPMLPVLADGVAESQDDHSPLRGPIDLFIAKQLQELELKLAPPAQPHHLLRRVTFDLTGLPPTEEAIARFSENARAPDAYEREVDRLLASPAFGEHIAQSWLDLARFAETDGFEHDLVRPEAWRYRDWVVAAVNDDMPYDRFMRMQVAGDLLEADSGALATMFCLAGPDMPDINDQQERRHTLLNEMTATVGAVFLGLQLGCAACHDHKYDPVSQADFYRLRGVLETGVPELERNKPSTMMQEQSEPQVPFLYQRGDHRQPAAKLARGVPRIVASEQTARLVATSNRPRLALADWLSSAENPLPSRTMANRIWQSHFGRGLAATPSDMGLVGIEPTHGDLLDWLASELRGGQWSLKRLRRHIVFSATYQQASLAEDGSEQGKSLGATFEARFERDPENHAFSRYPRRRLSGEALRDSMLSVAGTLNRQAGGKSVMPPLPSELVSTLLPGQWKTSADPADHSRRSIYVFARRNLRYPIFETFDRPDAGASCPERGRSVTATQSLLLFNSEFSLDVAEALADQAAKHADDPTEMASFLWLRTLSRPPSAMECELLKSFLNESSDARSGLVAIGLALLNSNEFLIVD